MSALRVTPMRVVEIEGLGEEIQPCADKQAEHFALEEQQMDGRWLVLSDHHTTRGEAEVALHHAKPLSDAEFTPLFAPRVAS